MKIYIIFLSIVVLLSTETHSFYVRLLYCHINSEIILFTFYHFLHFIWFQLLVSVQDLHVLFSPLCWCLYSCIFFFYSFYPLGKTPGGRSEQLLFSLWCPYFLNPVHVLALSSSLITFWLTLLHTIGFFFFFSFLKDFYGLLVYHHNDYVTVWIVMNLAARFQFHVFTFFFSCAWTAGDKNHYSRTVHHYSQHCLRTKKY